MLFDPVECMTELREADFTEAQARVQANILLKIIRDIEEKQNNETVTKSDVAIINANLRETELRLQKEIKDSELTLTKEIEIIHLEGKERELRLQKDIKDTELRLIRESSKSYRQLLLWQITGWAALFAIMAKGFGWLGF